MNEQHFCTFNRVKEFNTDPLNGNRALKKKSGHNFEQIFTCKKKKEKIKMDSKAGS